MITPSQIYWLSKLDDVKYLFDGGTLDGMSFAICFISFIAAMFVTIGLIVGGNGMNESEKANVTRLRNISWKVVIASFAVQLACGIVSTFVPSTKQMAAIVVIPRIANSETVSELGDLGKDLIVLAKEWVEEMKPSAKKDK